MPSKQLEDNFDSLPDGIIVCDREGKILRANTAALTLFEVPSEALCRGRDYQEFLQRYEGCNEPQPASALEPWLTCLLVDEDASCSLQHETRVFQVPSGRTAYVTLCAFPLLDARKQAVGTISVFHDITHRYQKALHLQRVHQAVSALREAIAHLPEHLLDVAPLERGIFPLSPPVLFVAQKLVDVIGQVLHCQDISLLALGAGDRVMYAVGRGLTPELEQYLRETQGYFLPSDFLDAPVLTRLAAGQEVVLPNDRLHWPTGFRADPDPKNLLLVPLLLEQQLAGSIVIAKAGFESGYTPEEIELVKAVAAETMLVIDGLNCLYEQGEMCPRTPARQELSLLINEFLNLASHELNTPLTVIKGNLQLAQRRLARLKRQLAEQPGGVSEQLEQLQHPLASATQSARLEERIIQDLLDDARIQSNTLQLHLTRWDLNTLLREAVATQQRAAPGRTIMLESLPPECAVPVMADAERITQVITRYLTNALSSSPADQPVTVQLTVEGAVARVSVHDQGPGIPAEEQGRIWERLYHVSGMAVQHELDLSLGSGFYLSRAFIERHQGSVGVQSALGRGATFWFTLPVEGSPQR
ncbi:MAG TPA: PAS domain-containing sensor histidine kinase [Ktedonobacteraceae bacterium]